MNQIVPHGDGPPPSVPPEESAARFGGGPHARTGDFESGMELHALLRVLRRHWLLILLVTTAATGGALFLALQPETLYRATAAVQLEDERRALTGGLESTVDRAVGGRIAPDPINSQLQVLRSRLVLGEAVERTGLRAQSGTRGVPVTLLEELELDSSVQSDTVRFEFGPDAFVVTSRAPRQRAEYGERVNLAGIHFTVRSRPGVERAEVHILAPQRAIERLQENLRTRTRDQTNVVDVEFTANDPLLAQRVVNTLVEVFQEQNAQQARLQSQRRRVFLEEQLQAGDSLLVEAQDALSDFRRGQQVLSSREQFAAQQSGLFSLDVRREELASSRRMFREMLDGLDFAEQGAGTERLQALIASPEIAQNPVVAGLFEQLVRFETQRDSLTHGPWGRSATNPDVARVDQQILSTSSRLESALRSHLENLDGRLAALDRMRASAAAEIETLPATEAIETRLVQQVETVWRSVNQLRDEYQRARIAEAVEVGQVSILEYAPVPMDPVGTGRAMKVLLGLMAGLMLGVAGAFLRENLDTAIRRGEEVESLLRVRSLGVIPKLTFANGRARSRRAKGSGVATGTSIPPSGRELVTVSDARSPSAEAFKTLRTNLLFSDAVSGLRTLVLTSAMPAEGKTTTVANLGVAYAQQGMRVLLVDSDLRKARLHQIFAVDRSPGLTEFVMGYNTIDEVIRESVVEKLDILPSGTLPPNPSELLGGARMRAALATLGERYDIVILDTPPLMAGADAAILGSMADGVVMVLCAGLTDRETARNAVRQLDAVGARVLGAILNDPEGELPRYGRYYAYQYKYYEEAS